MDLYAIFYSKFSNASQRFLALMETIPKLKTNCTMICVDNRQVRERITNDPKLSIQQVPSVVRIFADTGYTELFEGEKAFALLKNMIQDDVKPVPAENHNVHINIPPSTPTPTPSPGLTPLLPPKLPQQMSLKQHMDSVELTQPLVVQAAPIPIASDQGIQFTKTSSYEEIVPSKPPTNGPSNASYLEEIEKENMQRGAPERTIKNNANSGGSLVLRAQQMQKEREMEMSTPGPGMRSM